MKYEFVVKCSYPREISEEEIKKIICLKIARLVIAEENGICTLAINA